MKFFFFPPQVGRSVGSKFVIFVVPVQKQGRYKVSVLKSTTELSNLKPPRCDDEGDEHEDAQDDFGP